MKQSVISIAVFAALSSVFLPGKLYAAEESTSEQSTVNEDAEVLTIMATRAPLPASSVPATITVIDGEEIRLQLSVANSLSDILGNLVPSFSPSRQKLTSSGETLRGRKPLYLIDGVPQSNPLRDGARAANTIDPLMIERVEVIHGASAIQGMGASGGIINIVTKSASGTSSEVNAGFSAQPTGTSDGMSYHAGYLWSHGTDDYEIMLGGHLRESGLYFDGNGNAIGVDTTQGDTMDSSSQDFFGKFVYRMNDEQEIRVMLNHYQLASNGDYITITGDRAAGIPAISRRGVLEGDPAENDITTASVELRDSDFLGGALNWQLFSQDFSALYGGGRFATFQDPAYGTDIFDQSRNDSNKLGSRITINWQKIADMPVDMTAGVDFLEDTTFQELAQTGRKWVPETSFENWAPYVQARYMHNGLTLSAGLRYEYGNLKVDDFTTLYSYNSSFVEGGSPSFNELLTNFGAVYNFNSEWRGFISVSEAFSMPDVGRVLRAIDQPDQQVESFLNLQPVVTDNNEIGVEYRDDALSVSASYFESNSDLGARLSPNSDGIFIVNREKTEISGFELDTRYAVNNDTTFGLMYADTEGDFDSDDDGQVDTPLGGSNMTPRRLNLYWTQYWNGDINTRLQWNQLFDRNIYSGAQAINNFDGYDTFDFTMNIATQNIGEFTIGVENLLDEYYFTYYAQTAGNDARNFTGRGRTISVNWRNQW